MDATSDAIDAAFANDTNLRKRVFDALNETPQYASLFADIATYHLMNRTTTASNAIPNLASEHPSKKRRIDNPENGTPSANLKRTEILEIKDVSFTLPQRKKFHLSIVQYGPGLHDSKSQFAVCAKNPATNQVEFEHDAKDLAYILQVPVPEKAQKQYNFCLLPATTGMDSVSLATGEGIIWTVNHGPLKSYQILSSELKEIVGDESVLEKSLNTIMQRYGKKLTQPSEKEFASAVPEAHRKHEKAYHVKAHRGSKDGFLFFLENGIFFGFKKPLAFFPLHEIESVSYTNVLQRTFNLVVTFRPTMDAESQEIEFSMLDQADFAGIDGYIKQHHLQDASLAEARRAKQYKVNGKTADPGSEQTDDRTELEKAEAEMVDEEDEMEEDYDPGSGDDSEGSGSSDEEDEDYDDKSARDLVQEELGSEAEDVELTDEEEEGEGAGDEEEEEAEDQSSHNDAAHNDKFGTKETTGHVSHPVSRPPHTSLGSSHISAGAPDLDDEDQL